MILTINKLMQSESDVLVKIGHLLYQHDAGDNGLTPDQAEELAKMLLDYEEDIMEVKEEGFNEGYELGKDDGYDEGYEDGRKEDGRKGDDD